MTENEKTSLGSRLSKLEAMVSGLAEDVTNLTQSLRSFATPNWSTYIGFAGIILTIVAMVGGAVFAGYSSTQRRLESNVATFLERALELEYRRGVSETQINAIEVITKKLDVDLQREMRDVNAKTEVALHALDVRLQDEMKRTAAVGSEDRLNIKGAVSEMRAYQDKMREVNAAQDEKIRGLERIAWPALKD